MQVTVLNPRPRDEHALTLTTHGGTLLLQVACSAYRIPSESGTPQQTAAAGTLECGIAFDGNPVGSVWGYTNEAWSHKALVPGSVILTGISAGEHLVWVYPGTHETWADENDFITITVFEY